MSDEIKKLVRRLRDHGKYLQDALGLNNAPFALTSAADALEALVKERDRLKAALVRLRDCDWVITLPDRMDAVREIAREALEAKE